SPAQEKKHGETLVYLPREHDPERSAWRGLASLVADLQQTRKDDAGVPDGLRPGVLEGVARLVTERHLPRGFLIRARTVGATYGTQQSVIDEIVDDRVSMDVVLLHRHDREYAQQAIDAVKDADEAVKALGDLASDLQRAAGLESDTPRRTARDRGFAELEGPYREWLAMLGEADDPYAQRTAWQRHVHERVSRLGRQLVRDAGDGAWQGRTVATKQGGVWLNSSLAYTWFVARLRRPLGLIAHDGLVLHDGIGPFQGAAADQPDELTATATTVPSSKAHP
ncbi:MAG: type I-E CRISPR-associated protein Cse1/CasA, partial [Streptomyces sp.]|nr:type I-E CRISPR-associated protein Cse1/CasA [Streptomyces sp.]